jgi:hypothetical protein
VPCGHSPKKGFDTSAMKAGDERVNGKAFIMQNFCVIDWHERAVCPSAVIFHSLRFSPPQQLPGEILELLYSSMTDVLKNCVMRMYEFILRVRRQCRDYQGRKFWGSVALGDGWVD